MIFPIFRSIPAFEVGMPVLRAICCLACVKPTAQIGSQLESFKETGGFTENMTTERLEARRTLSVQANAPNCPICGKPMISKIQKRGQRQGREFWGCSDYPRCIGTRQKE